MSLPQVPANLDAANFAAIKAITDQLLASPLDTREQVEAWLVTYSQLIMAVDEEGTNRYNHHACNTDKPEAEKAYLGFVEDIAAKLEPIDAELQRKYLASPAVTGSPSEPHEIMTRNWQADVEIYRDENVPLQTQVTRLNAEYSKLIGAMQIEHNGETLTLQQAARYLEEQDRGVRQKIWESSAARRLQDRDEIESIFEKQLELRHNIALNAGLESHRDYVWKRYKRFDYTPDDCFELADSIEKLCLPLVKQLNTEQKEELNVDSLRPWDLAVDPKGRPPLRPFNANDIDGFVGQVTDMLERVSPTLAEEFGQLRMGRNLNLESRKGKRAGGYQASLEKSGEPFIFMNAAGLQRDVETLLHEAGHAFHFKAAAQQPMLTFERHAAMEFCEVASMSMELLALEHYDVFYEEQDKFRAQRAVLEGVIRSLPWMATIDSFQHWLYTHPGHSADERKDAWLSILGRFSDEQIDYSDHQASRDVMWHRQGHLFSAPFYYVEYAIAQLGALQVWVNYRKDPEKSLSNLRKAFMLGGSAPLPKLFETAGIRFDFSKSTIEPLVKQVQEQIAGIPV